MGVDHLIVQPLFYDPGQVSQERLQRIIQFFLDHMELRYQVPDGKLRWYSFKSGKKQLPVTLNREDAQEFPFMFAQEARAQISAGNLRIAREMLEAAASA